MSAQTSSFGLGFARFSCHGGLAAWYRILPIRLPSPDSSKSLIRTMPASAMPEYYPRITKKESGKRKNIRMRAKSPDIPALRRPSVDIVDKGLAFY
jgi:hypothetical protein